MRCSRAATEKTSAYQVTPMHCSSSSSGRTGSSSSSSSSTRVDRRAALQNRHNRGISRLLTRRFQGVFFAVSILKTATPAAFGLTMAILICGSSLALARGHGGGHGGACGGHASGGRSSAHSTAAACHAATHHTVTHFGSHVPGSNWSRSYSNSIAASSYRIQPLMDRKGAEVLTTR